MGDVLVGQFPVAAADHRAQVAGINKEDFVGTVTEASPFDRLRAQSGG